MMQTNQITSKDGDTLSSIAYRHYGSSAGQVERILQANPRLCRYPALLPPDLTITMPPPEAARKPERTINLWD